MASSVPMKKTLPILMLLWTCLLGSHHSQAAGILILGDSLSAAYGMSEDKGWVALLRQRLQQQGFDQTVINASVSGETTAGGARRLPKLLEQHAPDLVIVELGGNDGLRGYPIQKMRANLERIIELSQQHNAHVLLLGMQLPPNYGKQYTSRFYSSFDELAAHHQTSLVSFFLEGVGTNPKLMQNDGVHPTAEAQPIMLNTVWPMLAPLL